MDARYSINHFDPTDLQRLDAASGWVSLGQGEEALQEFHAMSEDARAHPLVSELTASLHQIIAPNLANEESSAPPPGCVETALIRAAYFQYLRPVDELVTFLTQSCLRFPESAELQYNTACALSMAKRFTPASEYLERAFALDYTQTLATRALHDPDLAEFWSNLGKHSS